MTYRLKIILFITSCLVTNTAKSQIIYSNDSISITGDYNPDSGQTRSGYKAIQFHHFGGCYWNFKGKNYPTFFQLDIQSANPRLAGTGNRIVFFNTATSTFNSIEVANIYNSSDAKLKTNIKPISNGLCSVLELNPVNYNWAETKKVANIEYQSDSENNDESKRVQYGFVAQDVERILPDIVRDSDTGNKLINYTAIIPLLVQAIQELEKTVEEQATTIQQLTYNQQFKAKSTASSYNKILSYTPNPTTGHITFELQLDEYDDAELLITNLGGNQELHQKVSDSSITIDLSYLPNGIHIASLYVGGKFADSCRIIKQ